MGSYPDEPEIQMNEPDQRHVLGCKAVGMLAGIVKSGALDHLPTIKQMAIDLDAEWEATFEPQTKETT
jgi:hypothetical protein